MAKRKRGRRGGQKHAAAKARQAQRAEATTELIDPKHIRRDLATIERAVDEGWGITPKMQRQLPETMDTLTRGRKRDERVKVGAARVLVAMDRNNIARRALGLKEIRYHDGTRPQSDVINQTQVNVNVDFNDVTPEQLERFRASALGELVSDGDTGPAQAGQEDHGGSPRHESNGHAG